MTRLPLACVFLLSLFPAAAGVSFAGPPALIIANAEYDETLGLMPLVTPAQDAKVMKAALEDLAEPFEVTVHQNLKKKQMREVVTQFLQKNAAEPVMFIYYSGHGMQVSNANYLLATDSDLRLDEKAAKLRGVFSGNTLETALETLKRETAEQEALPLNDVLALMPAADPMKMPLRIVVLDSCRSPWVMAEVSTKGFFKTKSSGGLARVDEKPGLFIGFAASANQEAQQNDDRRFKDGVPPSLFTEHLAKRLREGGPVDGVFNQASTDVFTISTQLVKEGIFNGIQTPARYALAYKPYVFAPSGISVLDSLMIKKENSKDAILESLKLPESVKKSTLEQLRLKKEKDAPGSTSIFDQLQLKK